MTEATPKKDTQQIADPSKAAEDTNTSTSTSEVPERYQGKSQEELIKMHQEATKLMHGSTQEAAQAKEEAADLRKILETVTPMITTNKGPEQSFEELYRDDPEKAIQQEIDRRGKPLEGRVIRALVDLDRERTKLRYGEDFERNLPAVEKIFKEMPELTYRPDAYEVGYLILKGRESEKIKAQAIKEGKKTDTTGDATFVEGAGKKTTSIAPTDSELVEEAKETGNWEEVIKSRLFPTK